MDTSTEKKTTSLTNSQLINAVAIFFTAALFIGAAAAAFYQHEWGTLISSWITIMLTPGPLVTDYFKVGGMAATFLNAGACGAACVFFMLMLKGDSKPTTLAGYFLVITHCFYGLNFLNMWPCFLTPFIYLYVRKLNFKSNLQICMFATAFAPFVSELLFRYTQGESFDMTKPSVTIMGLILTLLFALIIGFAVPAILPGANAWHKGYDLFNGGLAFGIFGFFLFNFLYRTMEVPAPGVLPLDNAAYMAAGHSYHMFANIFYVLIFVSCLVAGFILNGKSFKGLDELCQDTGYKTDFAEKYGMPVCLINIGIYGLFFLAYLNLVVLFTEGAGFTGPTFGVIFAALTFTCMGQHVRNIWPILLGYQILYLVAYLFSMAGGWGITWTVSTQGYINAIAFATGMCPIVGRYGILAGIAAGFFCASMCTATSALHGGLMLYNGGFTAGITVLVLLPILEHYVKNTRDNMGPALSEKIAERREKKK